MRSLRSAIGLFFVCASVAMAGRHSYTNTYTTTVRLLAPAGAVSGPSWATDTAYTQGTVVTNSRGQTYMNITQGTKTSGVTSASMPAAVGTTTNDATITWFSTLGSASRGMWSVQILSGSGTLVWDDPNAASGEGVIMSPTNVVVWTEGGYGVFQGSVYFVTTNATLSVTELSLDRKGL